MANPIVTTYELIEEGVSNSSITFLGNTINNGWEVTLWGFWWYKKDDGVETKAYLASSTTPKVEGDFNKFKSSLLPYTIYVVQARCYYRKWNDELEDYDYIEIFGEWVEITTHAYGNTDYVFACNINKGALTADFHADILDSDGGNIIERGFQWGLTRTPTWTIGEEGVFSEGIFSLPVTGLPSNTDFYVRGYLKSISGHYRYTYDGVDGGWRKVTTRVLSVSIAGTESAGYLAGNWYCYLLLFDSIGNEVNSYPIGEGYYVWRTTVTKDGNIFIGAEYGAANSYRKYRLSDGAFLGSFGATAWCKGISVGMDGNIYTLEGTTIFKRHPVSLNVIESIALTGTNFQGLALDSDNFMYTNRTDGDDQLQKYVFAPSYPITMAMAGGDGFFVIAGNHLSEFPVEDKIVVSGSTANDGTYTIVWNMYSLGYTYIFVVENVPSSIGDGSLKSGESALVANINSPIVQMGFSDLAVMGDYVYSGAYFDYPIKAPKDLSSVSIWEPAGEWYGWGWFWVVQPFNGKILLEGSPATTYNRRLALYDTNEQQIWYSEIQGGLDGISGYPFPLGATLINTKATKLAGHLTLYGEITEIIAGSVITERGFEYKIQDEEPTEVDTGTEVKEIGDFEIGEYHLSSWDTFNDLYRAEADIIWWFRAYCKTDMGVKSTAETWMKNLPTVITEAMTNMNYNKADGNGIIVSKGASELTLRGFEVIHEFYGRLPDSWRFEIGGFEGEPEQVVVHDDFGVRVIDIHWEGTLIKTVSESYELVIGVFSLTIGVMILGWPLMQDCLVEGKDYACKAFAENVFGRVYGEEVDFSTLARTYLSDDTPTVGLSIVKNEIIENLPAGVTASRRGFRYGTTEAADEFDVHENGSFTNGPYSMMLVDLLPDTTYYVIAYIIVDGITYEGELETITTDPEGEEDEDEYPTPHFSPHGQDYREVETKVFAEVLASQGIIDFSGGKKTLPITNHLIQTNPNAKLIADDYLSRFKLAKTRMEVTFPTPLPFEREDTVDFSFGALLFKEDDEGVINFKEDGEGAAVLMDQISMIIKKINSVGLTKTLESVDYTAVLDLEHE